MGKPKSPAARGVRWILLRATLAAHIVRRLGPPIALTAIYTSLAALVLHWDIRRHDLPPPDFGATLYAMFTLLFFEPTADFPASPVSRAVFWVTPILGALLIAQGIIKVGAPLLESEVRQKLWARIMSENMRGHVVVCGLGHVGYRVTQELLRIGEEVVGIEIRAAGAFVDSVRDLGVPVHVGDARRDELIKICGVERAKAIVCATSDDLVNLEVALDAKRFNPSIRVVMRMFDQKLAHKVGGALELDASFSTSALSAPIIALQATQARVLSAYRLDDTVRVTAEAAVGDGKPDCTVSALEADLPCRIVGRRGRGATSNSPARPGDVVRAGDVLVVDVAAPDLPSVRYRLGG